MAKKHVAEDKDLDSALEAAAKSNTRLYKHKTLELNADYNPVRFYPLSTQNWAKVMFWLVKGWSRESEGGRPIITVLEEYDDVVVRAARRSIRLPSVIAHTDYIPPPKRIPFTRSNVLLRDNFTCQYTGQRLSESQLTLDHVLPQSRGGKTTWTNIVACDQKVNEGKSNRTPQEAGLVLLSTPREPTAMELQTKARILKPPFIHESWRPYLRLS